MTALLPKELMTRPACAGLMRRDFICPNQNLNSIGETMMTHDEMIAVIQAHKERKEIQSCLKGNDDWRDVLDPYWDFRTFNYREKPEPPKPREFWVNLYPNFGCAYTSKAEAESRAAFDRIECLHVQVIP
jgi:hypothetical protein